MSERTWPENSWPTPEQWVAWFLSCDEGERLNVATRAIDDAQKAEACFLRSHDTAVEAAESLSAEVERLHSWAGLMELLDEHWPADIFPTIEPDDRGRDTGPRIVSLLRWVDRLQRENDQRADMAFLVGVNHGRTTADPSATDAEREERE